MTDVLVPSSAQRLAKVAAEHGWRVKIDTAYGVWKDKAIDSVLVRLKHPNGTNAVAQWIDGKAAGAWQWPVPGFYQQREKIAMRELTNRVKAAS